MLNISYYWPSIIVHKAINFDLEMFADQKNSTFKKTYEKKKRHMKN